MSDETTHVTGIVALSFDATDAAALAGFWQRLLGGRVVPCGADAELHGAAVRIDFLQVPEPKSVKNRMHLDLGSDDHDAAVAHALGAGATRADDVYDGGGWTVLRDPEGNEFCVLRPAASTFAGR